MKKISIASDFEFDFAITRKATATGSPEAAKGITTAEAWLSLTDGGEDVGSTTTALTERSGNDASYFGILDAAAIASAIGDRVGRRVYGVLNIEGDDRRSEPLMVVDVLPPS